MQLMDLENGDLYKMDLPFRNIHRDSLGIGSSNFHLENRDPFFSLALTTIFFLEFDCNNVKQVTLFQHFCIIDLERNVELCMYIWL